MCVHWFIEENILTSSGNKEYSINKKGLKTEKENR